MGEVYANPNSGEPVPYSLETLAPSSLPVADKTRENDYELLFKPDFFSRYIYFNIK
jgi:hypothetical protein